MNVSRSQNHTRRRLDGFLVVLIISAALLRFMVAYSTVHLYDLNFYVAWSTGVARDFSGAYNNIASLDYPPLFLFLLYPVGLLLESGAAEFLPYRMLALKGWQVIFDLLLIPLIYRALKPCGRYRARAGAALWAVNPTIICSSSYWGQTDSIMLFLLVLAFLLLSSRHEIWAGVVVSLACLMKFQSLYFAPLFLLFLLAEYPLKKVVRSIAAGAATAAAVFMPFMLRSGAMLPWRIYFGGLEKYQGVTLNAFNFFGMYGLNLVHAGEVSAGWISAEFVSFAAIILSIILLVVIYFTATDKSVWLLGFMFIQTIFIFTTRMHERYQIPAVLFGLLACVVHRSRGLLGCYAAVTVMTFLNHFLVLQKALAGAETGGWLTRFGDIAAVMSAVNVGLYLATIAVAVRVLYRHGAKPIAFWRRGRIAPPGKNN